MLVCTVFSNCYLFHNLSPLALQEYNQLRYHFSTADVLLIAFSLTDSSSLDTALHIRQLANGYCGQFSRIPAVLIGTKLDLDSTRVVGFEEGVSVAKEVGCSYIETSAASNRGVGKAFAKAVQMVPCSMPDYDMQGHVHRLQKKRSSSTLRSVKGLLRRCSAFTLRTNSAKIYNARMGSV